MRWGVPGDTGAHLKMPEPPEGRSLGAALPCWRGRGGCLGLRERLSEAAAAPCPPRSTFGGLSGWSCGVRGGARPWERERRAGPGQAEGAARPALLGVGAAWGSPPRRVVVGRVRGRAGAERLLRIGGAALPATFKLGRAEGRQEGAAEPPGHGLAERRAQPRRPPRPRKGRRSRHWRRPRLRPQQAAAGADDPHDERRQGHLRLPRVRQPLQVDRDHPRGRGHGVRGPAVQAVPGVPQRLPLQRAGGALPDALLPPQRGPAGEHLPGHPQGEVVRPLRRPHRPPLHTEPARRAQHREPFEYGGRGALDKPASLQEAPPRSVCEAHQELGDLTLPCRRLPSSPLRPGLARSCAQAPPCIIGAFNVIVQFVLLVNV